MTSEHISEANLYKFDSCRAKTQPLIVLKEWVESLSTCIFIKPLKYEGADSDILQLKRLKYLFDIESEDYIQISWWRRIIKATSKSYVNLQIFTSNTSSIDLTSF